MVLAFDVKTPSGTAGLAADGTAIYALEHWPLEPPSTASMPTCVVEPDPAKVEGLGNMAVLLIPIRVTVLTCIVI